MRAASVLLVLLAACSSPESGKAPTVSKEPISVRGWIADVEQPGSEGAFKTAETEAVRKMQLFQGMNIWVDNAPYVSGGVAENGAFLLLDVPPGTVTVEFTPPGARTSSKLVLENIPGNADVFVPGVVLKSGTIAVLDPKAVQVRMASRIDKPVATKATATVAGLTIPVMNVPFNALTDRHDYPTPPGGSYKPLATVH